MTQIDDIDENDADSEKEKNVKEDIEKDKISPKKQDFILFNYCFLDKNTVSLNFASSLLTAQYPINTPPPEMLLNV